MSGIWTQAMDDQLWSARVDKRLPWRTVAPIGEMNARKCQKRLKYLEAQAVAAGRPVQAKAADVAEPGDRDGLAWLISKKRLSHAQGLMGKEYRRLFRALDPGGSIKTVDLMATGGGKGGGLPPAYEPGDVDAKLKLFVIRWNILHGERDMLTVVDGVCGHGHTVRYLAGGDQVRAAQLEALLKAALNMMIASDNAKAAALAKRNPPKAA